MQASPSAPARNAVEIIPSNASTYRPTKGLYVGSGGDLTVEMESGEDVTFVGVAAGAVYPFSVTRVYATGTGASDIVLLY